MKRILNKQRIIIFFVLFSILISVTACTSTCPQLNGSAPGFTLENLMGEQSSLQDYQGKIVLLTFWTTWCEPCKYELPYFQKIYEKYSSYGLVVLAVNVKETYARASNYVKTQEYTFPVLLDADGVVAQEYCVPAFPSTILIDKQGIIRNGKVGAFRDMQEIEDALASLQ